MRPFRYLLPFGILLLLASACAKKSDTTSPVILPGNWVQTRGPGSGIIRCMAVVGDTILAGAESNGLFFSANGGGSWVQDKTAVSQTVTTSAVVAVNDTTIFAISDMLYRSYNRGVKWEGIASLPSGTVTLSANNSLIVTGTQGTGGVSVSRDGGKNWSQSQPGSGNYLNSVAIIDQDIFDGTTGAGVFYSHDYGLHWESLNLGLSNLDVRCLLISRSLIYAGTAKGIFLTSNKGQNWSLLSSGLPTDLPVSCIAASGTSLLIGNQNGIWHSADGGTNWDPATGDLPVTDIRSLAICGSSIVAGTANGLFRSGNNGISWSLVGVAVSTVKSMCIDMNNLIVAAGGDIPLLYITADQGNQWSLAGSVINTHKVASLAFSSGYLVAGTDSGIFISRDQCHSWSSRSSGLASLDVRTVSTGGSYWFAGTFTSGFFRSANNGENWQKLSTGIPDDKFVFSVFCQGSEVFAGTSFGGLLISKDYGLSWIKQSQVPENTVISSFAASGSTVYAGTYNGVWESDDSGQTWYATTLSNQVVNSMLIIGENVFAGVQTWGIFSTALKGTKWAMLVDGLTYKPTVTSLATDGTMLYAGTQGLGVWTHPLK
ncbi:MAG: hypothetical protein WCI48_09555 [Bacteroidota bacterium]|jgi:hypothetical protein